MRFPDWLYRLLPGDQGSQLLSIVWREVSTTANLATVGATVYQVPGDKCLVLTNIAGRFAPTAAVAVSRRRFIADPPEGTTRYNIYDDETDVVAGAAAGANWQGEVVIPGGWKVRVEAGFNAAGANNTAEAEIFGYLIPRGSFIFG